MLQHPHARGAGPAGAGRRAERLAELRSCVRALEMAGPRRRVEAAPFGAPEVDGALPWGGLPRARAHEIVAAGPDDGAGRGVGDAGGAATAAAEGFCAALLARLVVGRGPALWCLARAGLHGPGLGAFGLDPDRLIVARARRPADVLWAMEEGLRSGRLGAVLGEVRALDLTAGRRLQLAAGAGGAACLVLRPPEAEGAPGAAITRWRVAAAPGAPGLPELVGAPRWRVELVRCRGGTPRRWLLEWNDETGCLSVAATICNRSADTPAWAAWARLAG